MLRQSSRRPSGFTLVEIMIVVAIIALLAAIAVPSFLRARKRAQATETLETLRMLDAAKEQYAIENRKPPNTFADSTDLIAYVKVGTKLYKDLAANCAHDALGRDIAVNVCDQPCQITHATWNDFAPVLGSDPTAFWGPYGHY